MARNHSEFKASRGLSDEEEESDPLAAFDEESEESTSSAEHREDGDSGYDEQLEFA